MRKTLFITLLSMALLTPLHAAPPEDEQDQLLQGLRNKIAELRSGGNFSAAVVLAEELLTTLQTEPGIRRDQMVDAEWLLRTTRLLATLPHPLQEKLVLKQLIFWTLWVGGVDSAHLLEHF